MAGFFFSAPFLFAVIGLSLAFGGSFLTSSTGLTAAAHDGFSSFTGTYTSSFLAEASANLPQLIGTSSTTDFPQTGSYLAGGSSFFFGAS